METQKDTLSVLIPVAVGEEPDDDHWLIAIRTILSKLRDNRAVPSGIPTMRHWRFNFDEVADQWPDIITQIGSNAAEFDYIQYQVPCEIFPGEPNVVKGWWLVDENANS